MKHIEKSKPGSDKKKKGLSECIDDSYIISRYIVLITLILCFISCLYLLFSRMFSSPEYLFFLIKNQTESIKSVLLSLIIGFAGAFILDYSHKTDGRKKQ